jgi:hypothetical protein
MSWILGKVGIGPETKFCNARLKYFPSVYTGKESVGCKHGKTADGKGKTSQSFCHIGSESWILANKQTQICCDKSYIDILGKFFEERQKIVMDLIEPGALQSLIASKVRLPNDCVCLLRRITQLDFDKYLSGEGSIGTTLCVSTLLVSFFLEQYEKRIKGLSAILDILMTVPSYHRAPKSIGVQHTGSLANAPECDKYLTAEAGT